MRPDKQNINFVNKEVVNYSAIANKAKSLSDGIRSIDFDSINDSIVFNSALFTNRPKIHVKPSNNSVNNVSKINFNDTSTITGITSDSSNTDPTKAISTAIILDINDRIEKLETKTQNQTATKNETAFTGNVVADTFNGYHLGINQKFYNIPAIPVIRDDLVMEVGRYIDFHYNAASGTDYTSRLSISRPGTLYYDHSFIVSADIKARNCIADGGNLNDIASRTKSLETKNTEQDTRLDALESKDIAFEERIGSIEAVDTAQNETINNIETKNTEQDTRLTNIETKNTEQDTRLTNIETKNTEQEVRLNDFDDSLGGLDNRLNTLESNQITLTMKKFEHFNYHISGTASFANNIFTFVFEEQPTTGAINFVGDFFDGNETYPADFTMYFSYGAYSKMEIVYRTGILTDVFQGEYNSATLTFKLFGNNGNQTLNSFEESTLSIHMPNEKIIVRTQDTKSLNILTDDLTDNNVYSASKLLDIIYPIGSIYLSLTKSPQAIGTWELLSPGYFLQSTTSSSGETGGSTTHTHKTADHTLTINEMPKHNHTFNGHKISGTVYDIMRYDTAGQINKDQSGAFSVTRYGSRTWQGTDGDKRAFSLTFEATPTGSISAEGKNRAHNHGNTEAASNIPPFITCFMYKRTA